VFLLPTHSVGTLTCLNKQRPQSSYAY
jgi:hypothetical protein